ncbi:MAG: hypothetical protein FJ385_07225 [Verrucomicrobia bacterium]|nr:hypothetical protein [Verrucomicrobiota bacterium]
MKSRRMAWCINKAVVRGEIDNTVEGRVTGSIWLAGREDPIVLDLQGDCWRDLAGTRLSFVNPSPREEPDCRHLTGEQSGIVGDMTASRKVKLPMGGSRDSGGMHRLADREPFEWCNKLYLEWFCARNGRIVIESADYELHLTPHVWQMDEDAEEAQKLANLHAMRDFMARVIRRRESGGHDAEADALDEFEWEERLKESDRLTDAYQEVLEKYLDDPDSERKEAFVMGWDGLLDAMAERDEQEGAAQGGAAAGGEEMILSEADGEDDFDESEDHPLQLASRELALRAMDLVEPGSEPGTPSFLVVSNLLQVSGKLAAALNDRAGGYEPEAGYVLAILKRCLNWLNEAVGACQEIMTLEEDADQLAALAHLRSSIFEIRDGITELRRGMKP